MDSENKARGFRRWKCYGKKKMTYIIHLLLSTTDSLGKFLDFEKKLFHTIYKKSSVRKKFGSIFFKGWTSFKMMTDVVTCFEEETLLPKKLSFDYVGSIGRQLVMNWWKNEDPRPPALISGSHYWFRTDGMLKSEESGFWDKNRVFMNFFVENFLVKIGFRK